MHKEPIQKGSYLFIPLFLSETINFPKVFSKVTEVIGILGNECVVAKKTFIWYSIEGGNIKKFFRRCL